MPDIFQVIEKEDYSGFLENVANNDKHMLYFARTEDENGGDVQEIWARRTVIPWTAKFVTWKIKIGPAFATRRVRKMSFFLITQNTYILSNSYSGMAWDDFAKNFDQEIVFYENPDLDDVPIEQCINKDIVKIDYDVECDKNVYKNITKIRYVLNISIPQEFEDWLHKQQDGTVYVFLNIDAGANMYLTDIDTVVITNRFGNEGSFVSSPFFNYGSQCEEAYYLSWHRWYLPDTVTYFDSVHLFHSGQPCSDNSWWSHCRPMNIARAFYSTFDNWSSCSRTDTKNTHHLVEYLWDTEFYGYQLLESGFFVDVVPVKDIQTLFVVMFCEDDFISSCETLESYDGYVAMTRSFDYTKQNYDLCHYYVSDDSTDSKYSVINIYDNSDYVGDEDITQIIKITSSKTFTLAKRDFLNDYEKTIVNDYSIKKITNPELSESDEHVFLLTYKRDNSMPDPYSSYMSHGIVNAYLREDADEPTQLCIETTPTNRLFEFDLVEELDMYIAIPKSLCSDNIPNVIGAQIGYENMDDADGGSKDQCSHFYSFDFDNKPNDFEISDDFVILCKIKCQYNNPDNTDGQLAYFFPIHCRIYFDNQLLGDGKELSNNARFEFGSKNELGKELDRCKINQYYWNDAMSDVQITFGGDAEVGQIKGSGDILDDYIKYVSDGNYVEWYIESYTTDIYPYGSPFFFHNVIDNYTNPALLAIVGYACENNE
jgi:hypothetical protein